MHLESGLHSILLIIDRASRQIFISCIKPGEIAERALPKLPQRNEAGCIRSTSILANSTRSLATKVIPAGNCAAASGQSRFSELLESPLCEPVGVPRSGLPRKRPEQGLASRRFGSPADHRDPGEPSAVAATDHRSSSSSFAL